MIDAGEYQHIVEKTCSAGQEHVFAYWAQLSKKQRKELLSDLSDINFEQFRELIEMHVKNHKAETKVIQPCPVIRLPETGKQKAKRLKAFKKGRKAIAKGMVAAFLVAGGQGSRLGFEGPKGCLKISPVKHKTLFQLHAEKILAIQNRFRTLIPWYIMTSSSNHEQTLAFFRKKKFFGLEEENVMFVRQKDIPAVDRYGKLILKTKSAIFKNPDGSGGCFSALSESGAIDDMKKRGIRYIFYFQVDNVLTKILDPVYIGYHIMGKSDMSCKVLKKAHPEEKMGVVGLVNGKMSIVEYSNMSKEDMYAKNPDSSLKYSFGSLAIHVINVRFAEKISRRSLPFNKAVKKIPALKGNVEGIKFEAFVFDALPFAKSSIVMEVRREEEFAPVKNKEGVDSPDSAKKLLMDMYARWLEYCKVNVPRNEKGIEGRIEISSLYALDPDELKRKLPLNIRFTKGSSVCL